MTAEEFEARYAARSGVTVEFLHHWGRYAEPCDCGEPECEGWAMGHQWEDALIENAMRSWDNVTAPPKGVDGLSRALIALGVVLIAEGVAFLVVLPLSYLQPVLIGVGLLGTIATVRRVRLRPAARRGIASPRWRS